MPTSLAYFVLFYFFIYMGNAVYGTFIPLYFQKAGFSPSQIGTLLSVGPLVAIMAQPLWGTLSDRARTKNGILLLLIGGSGAAMLLFPLSDWFVYLLVIICVFTFFQTSVFAVSDAITLEVLERRKKGRFSLIRLAGTVGFAAMSIVFGIAAQKRVDLLFIVYALIMAVSFLLVLRFPAIAGHQTKERRTRIWTLFRNRKLTLYLAVNFILHITLGYYYTFFPLYFTDMGGSSAWLGWSMVISSLSEIPFLLFANRLFQRLRVHHLLLGAGAAAALRWFLFFIIEDPYWALPVQLLHGLIFIVLSVTMATAINREAPNELKASGQTLNALLSLGVARIIGSFAGGLAVEASDMRQVFLYNGVLALLCIAVFTAVFRQREKDTLN